MAAERSGKTAQVPYIVGHLAADGVCLVDTGRPPTTQYDGRADVRRLIANGQRHRQQCEQTARSSASHVARRPAHTGRYTATMTS